MNLFELVAPSPTDTQASTSPAIEVISKEEKRLQLKTDLARIHGVMKKRQYAVDPVLWANERLGDTLWSKQRDILKAVAAHRRVAVRSCHEVGKSFTAAEIVGWWLDTNKTGEAFVVTTAPTGPQVKAILWREIQRVHSRGKLRGRVNQTSWFMPTSDGKTEELVAFGRKPSDYDPTAFQGIHAPKVLVIVDEACGVRGSLWEAADSLIANDESKIVIFGNPDDPQTEFADFCKPGSGWTVVEINAFDSPNFTGEPMPKRVLGQLIGRTYVEEKRRKWAPNWKWNAEGTRCEPPAGARAEDTNPFWQSKILGRFPERGVSGGLIPISWILAAQQREIKPKDGDPNQLGVDVGAGGDSSCICHRLGGRYRIIHEDTNPDTMQTCGEVITRLEETGAELANIDEIGIGKGVTQRGQELSKPFVGINVGRAAFDDQHYVNLRAELYWNLREAFERGEVDLDPEDEDTAGELVEIRFKRLSNGKIQIESKDDMKKRGVKSPNRVEALMLSHANLPVEEEWVIG